MAENVIDGRQIEKTFKDFWGRPKVHAIRGIDISVPQGSIFGLLGPNGAGKSTLIKIMLGHLYCSKGYMRVLGKNPRDVAVKQHIGYLPERTSFYTNLNTMETLLFFGRLLGLSDHETKRRSKQLIQMVGLENATDRLVGEFSHGMRKRLGMAQALLNDPDLLLLDEPTAGLDPLGCREVKDLIINLGKRGKTVLMTSHLLGDVQDVCDDIMILYGGKVQASGKIEALLAKTDELIVRSPIVSSDTLGKVKDALKHEVDETAINISNPTRTLEDYFISIVIDAAKRNEGTSGAKLSDGIADYLSAASQQLQTQAPKASATESKAQTPAASEEKSVAKKELESSPAAEKKPSTTQVPQKAIISKEDSEPLRTTKQELEKPKTESEMPNREETGKPSLRTEKAPGTPAIPNPKEEVLQSPAFIGDGYRENKPKEIDYKTLDALTKKR